MFRDREPEQLVLRDLVINIEGAREPSVPETELCADVDVGCGLPSNVWITYCREGRGH